MFSCVLGAYYGYYLAHCQLNSHDSHDVVFLEQLSFNKISNIQYNIILGKVVGYTEIWEKYADILNKMPRFLSDGKQSTAKKVYSWRMKTYWLQVTSTTCSNVLDKHLDEYINLYS